MFGIQRSGFTLDRSPFHQLVPPVIPIRHHLDVVTGPSDDHDLFDRGRLLEALVHSFLQRQFLATSPAGVGGDDQLGLGVVVSLGHRVGTESSEDDRVDRTDAGTREHRDRQFGDHGHVQRDPVAGFDPELFQHVGEATDLTVQVLVAEYSRVARFAFPDDRGLVLSPVFQVPVETVVGDIQLAAGEPLGVGHVSLGDLLERLEPIQVLPGQFAPESVRVILGPLPHLLVLLLAGDVGVGRKGLRRRELAVFLKNTLNRIATHRDELLV